MFILYAMPLGLLAGFLTGGRLHGLSEVRFRWAPLALIGLLVQIVLFFGPVAERVGWLGMPIYVGSTALVLLVVLRNARLPGLAVVALGAASNMAAILANGGYMPASPAALAILGEGLNPGYSNSALVEHPMLAPLTDIFAMPPQVPFSNVFSVGDVLIGLGVAWALAAAMHARASTSAATAMTSVDSPARLRALDRIREILAPRSVPAVAAAQSGAGPLAATAVGPMIVSPRPVSSSLPMRAGTGRSPEVAEAVARLSRMPVTEAWATDHALATWLADNVDLVGAAADVTLSSGQILESERPVVLAEHEGQSVVIVSERGPATDDAFGCLVRHVAACQAELGIWICGELVDQHAATVAWLNVATGITFAMIGLAAVRIGESPPAALLELAVRAPRADDPRYQPGDHARAAGAGRRAGDWLRS